MLLVATEQILKHNARGGQKNCSKNTISIGPVFAPTTRVLLFTRGFYSTRRKGRIVTQINLVLYPAFPSQQKSLYIGLGTIMVFIDILHKNVLCQHVAEETKPSFHVFFLSHLILLIRSYLLPMACRVI